MPYFYLQVDRIDAESIGAFYYPMGTDAAKVPAKLATLLDTYRGKGFRIIHDPAMPMCKRATRSDGVKLELVVIQEERPIALGINVDWRGDDEPAAVH